MKYPSCWQKTSYKAKRIFTMKNTGPGNMQDWGCGCETIEFWVCFRIMPAHGFASCQYLYVVVKNVLLLSNERMGETLKQRYFNRIYHTFLVLDQNTSKLLPNSGGKFETTALILGLNLLITSSCPSPPLFLGAARTG